MKMYLISDNSDTYTGMRLAGVEGSIVHGRDELKETLDRVLSDREIAIIVLTENFGREYPDLIDNIRLSRSLPLLIEIPDRHGTRRGENFITAYMKEAVGLKL